MQRPIPESQLAVTLKRPRVVPPPAAQRGLAYARKVPEVTALFWIIKLLTTGMGETTSDYLVFHINPYIAVILGFVGLVVSLLLQFFVRRYIPAVYWLAVVMVAVFGTMAADVVHIVLGVPYLYSSVFFTVALAVIFAGWYLSEKTLSIHSITTRRRELFYWATILATFALGTAVGDMTASTFGLGYFDSGMLFAILFALPGLAYWLLGLNEVPAFWFAYIMTRPFGASYADWLGKPKSFSGLGLGTGPISMILAVIIIGLVTYVTLTRSDTHAAAEAAPRATRGQSPRRRTM